MQIVLVSGLSGSGKSIALKALEDAGYFAVDNLPATLIGALLESLKNCGEGQKIAISVDVRSAATIAHLPATIHALAEQGVDCRLMFLDANDEALTRRFSETRRPHPLAEKYNGMEACIAQERQLLADVAALSHRIDTSDVRPNTLRGWVKDWLALDRSRITLAFLSFGFKHGIAIDADFVFDVRFLPNPFYDPVLKSQTGQDQAVKAFFEADLNVAHLIDDVSSFIMRWLPHFVRDNRSAITVAIGCTGGQHRSVYIAEQLAQRFGTQQQVLIRHRDLAT